MHGLDGGKSGDGIKALPIVIIQYVIVSIGVVVFTVII